MPPSCGPRGAASSAAAAPDECRVELARADGEAERIDANDRPPPLAHASPLAIASLGLVNGAHFFTICSVFPYAGFLAVDNGWARDVDSAGYVAGFLATATVIARIPTSVLWGYAADRWGWYPAVQLSLASLAIGSLCFGVARPLWLALLSRCIFLGGLNGWPALTGLVCGEVGGEAEQAKVLSRVIGSGPIFALIGPAIGGWTYGLVEGLPPALPPNIFGAALAVVTMVAAHFQLSPMHRGRLSTAAPVSEEKSDALPMELVVATESTQDDDADKCATTHADAAEHTCKSDGAMSGDRPAARAAPATHSGCGLSFMSAELLLVFLYRATGGLVMYMIWDVFPLFCIASRSAGGLELSHEALGTLLSAAAVVQVRASRVDTKRP
mgnify:CR=1 FL=1